MLYMCRMLWVFVVGVIAFASSVLAQGSITPPGAPGETMRSLIQIEPRTPISSLPYEINNSGSYYITQPLFSTNKGITIYANNVTVDLMGFTLSGNFNTNYPGVHAAGGNDVMLRNIVIRNGGISQFGIGVLVENTQGGKLIDLAVQENKSEGIFIKNNDPGTCSDFNVENCTVIDNNGYGIHIRGQSESSRNRSHTVRGNKISGNGYVGVFVVEANGCVVEDNHFGPQVADDSTNAFAIRTAFGRNLVVRNFEQGNSNVFGVAYFQVSSADTYGPIVNITGGLASTNKEVNPWANFSR